MTSENSTLIDTDVLPAVEKKVSIYTLSDPVTGEVRYVGKAINYEARLKGHLNGGSVTHKENWINQLKEAGLVPIVECLEEVSASNWEDAERFWIETLRFYGCNLTNSTSGGDGGAFFKGRHHSEESKLKMSLNLSQETRALIAEANKKRVWSDSQRAQISENTKIALADPLIRAKISLALKGKKKPASWFANREKSELVKAAFSKLLESAKLPENKAKVSNGLKKKWLDPEFREKMVSVLRNNIPKSIENQKLAAAARRGMKDSPETIKRRLDSRAGYSHSPETRQKIKDKAVLRFKLRKDKEALCLV